MVSLYDGEQSIVVEAVQREERVRLDDLDELPGRIRRWEKAEQQASSSDVAVDQP